MKPLGLLSQVLAIMLAVAIVVFFVQPTFTEIGELQNETSQYVQERERATETNANLAALVSTLESVSVADRTRLATYMPTRLDEVAVLRDIEIMAQNTGVTYSVIQYNGETIDDSEEGRIQTEVTGVTSHSFSVSVEGTYSQLKDFLSLLEQNQYPLQASEIQISSLEGGFLLMEATIVTYVNNSVRVMTQ